MNRHSVSPVRGRTRVLVLAGVLGLAGVGAASGASASPPDSSPPDSSSPDSSSPDSSSPDSSSPDSSSPDSSSPDSSSPDSSEDQATSTEATATDATSTDSSVAEDRPDITAPEPDPSSTFQPAPIEWTENPNSPGTQEGHLEVPIDYANPDAGTFTLYVTRHPAAGERIGSLLVNPGGPGFGGSDFGTFAEQIYDQPLLDAFDIIGFDPRGTGASEPALDCVDDYDHFYAGYDITPDTDAERQQIVDLSQEFTDDCATRNADILGFVGTNNAARDMDSIRKAIGEETISYFGFSYGSELGATWATLFPETVRAAVLDGAADPNADALESSLQQTAGFEGTLTSYLANCSGDAACTFNNDGNAEDAFDHLMLKLDAKPIPSVVGRPAVSRGLALQAVAQAMYSDTTWPELSDALAAAQQGDGTGLLALYDSYYQRQPDGTWDNSLEAFQVISCMDDPERTTVEEEDAQASQFQDIAPRFAPGTTGTYFCSFFPPSIDPRVDITGAGAGPIVVCGATGDPATPLASTRKMAAALEDGRLIVIEADQHTCYGATRCADGVIDDYLVNLTVPPKETTCPAE